MPNLFDNIQDIAQSVVLNTMGYVASWTPSGGGPTQTETVLFNQPTNKDDISEQNYDAQIYKMEYLEGVFPNLFESIRSLGSETVIINGISYLSYRAERKYDGKTIIISLQPAS